MTYRIDIKVFNNSNIEHSDSISTFFINLLYFQNFENIIN